MGISETIYWSQYERVDRECDKLRPPKPRSALLDEASAAAYRADSAYAHEIYIIDYAERFLLVVQGRHADLLPHLGDSNSKWGAAAGSRVPELRPSRFRQVVCRIHAEGRAALVSEAAARRDIRLKAAQDSEAAARAMPENEAAESAWAEWLRQSSEKLDAIEYPQPGRPAKREER